MLPISADTPKSDTHPSLEATEADWEAARRLLGGGVLSIIMPAYNLGSVIAGNIRKVHEVLSPHFDIEIVVVNDGSGDETSAEMALMAAELPNVKPVSYRSNKGKGMAVCEGFRHATGDFILLLDADLDLPPHQVSWFFSIMEQEQADVVMGTKRHPRSMLDYPMNRRVISMVYFFLVKLLIGLPTRDTQTGIKLFKRAPLAWAVPRLLVKRFAFDLELLAVVHEKGFRLAEAPIILQFQKGNRTWGCVRARTVRNILTDTLAIFYRIRIKHYYRDPRLTEK